MNAKHIKQVPGRKTDVKDAQWIAQLLRHGLLKGSFIPEAPQRALRDLVRYRTKLIQQRSSEVNTKILEIPIPPASGTVGEPQITPPA